METLVATVLIVIVFMMSSLLLNSMFAMNVKQRHTVIHDRLHQLQYEYRHGALIVPHYETLDAWEISITPGEETENGSLLFRAAHPARHQILENTIWYAN